MKVIFAILIIIEPKVWLVELLLHKNQSYDLGNTIELFVTQILLFSLQEIIYFLHLKMIKLTLFIIPIYYSFLTLSLSRK